MTKIKLCGLKNENDIQYANKLLPEYIGFIFVKKSKRYVSPQKAAVLRKKLNSLIKPVGVFVDEPIENVIKLLGDGVIEYAQLHGNESEEYIRTLKNEVAAPIVKAFQINSEKDIYSVAECSADYVLLDSAQGGSGTVFNWDIIKNIKRPYFLAGGLNTDNVKDAINYLHPYAVDVSSGIETNGIKDEKKMAAFIAAVREEERI